VTNLAAEETTMNSNNIAATKDIRHWPIVVLRIFTGTFFAYNGFGKISRGNFENGLEHVVTSQLDKSFEFFRPFLESVVLPHNVLFGAMVSWGEFLIGSALIIGLATRYASIAGALMVMCFWFMKGQHIFLGTNHDSVWLVIFIVLAGFHAGRVAGLDGVLSSRFRFLA
jgi:thiosulfate dehydrogenase [quinone] large subunit